MRQGLPNSICDTFHRHTFCLLASLILLGTLKALNVRAQEAPPHLDTQELVGFAESLGLSVSPTNAYELRLDGHSQQFTLYRDSRRLLINGLQFYMNAPLTYSDKTWALTKKDADSVLRPLTQPFASSQTNRIVVVLDPGHGGTDPGAADVAGLTEKVLTLDIAQRIRRRFTHSGIDVKLTRNNDVFMPLRERTQRATEWNAAVFVSIHMNAAANPEAAGIETYVLPAAGFPSTSDGTNRKKDYPGNMYDAENSSLAYTVHRSLRHQSNANDRGIKRARFNVLCWAPCPAILIECGFLSSQNESTKLLSIMHREAIAEGITQGILTYLSDHLEVVLPPEPPEPCEPHEDSGRDHNHK